MRQFVIIVLLNIVNGIHFDESIKELARGILQNMKFIETASLEQTAALLNVSASTLKRFCKKAGFYNYSTFRDFLRETPPQVQSYDVSAAMLMPLLNHIDTQMHLEPMLKLIRSCRNIYYVGIDFEFQFLNFQKEMMQRGYFVQMAAPEYDDMPAIEKDDLVILLSMTGKRALRNRHLIRSLSCTKILMSQNEIPEIEQDYDMVLSFMPTDNRALHKYELAYLFDKIVEKI